MWVFCFLFLIAFNAYAGAFLTWTAPTEDVNGGAIAENELEYILYYSMDGDVFRSSADATGNGQPIKLTGTTYALPDIVPGGVECVYLALSASYIPNGPESDLSNTVQYCGADTVADDPGSNEPNPGSRGAPSAVFDLMIGG